MAGLDHFMGREQQARADFVAAMSALRPPATATDEAGTAFVALTEVTLDLGTSLSRTRQADRLDALGIDADQAAALRASAHAQAERALHALAGVRPFAAALTALDADERTRAAWRECSPRLRSDWRESLKDLDLDAEVVGELAARMDSLCDAVDEADRPGLGRHLSGLVDELEGLYRPQDAPAGVANVAPAVAVVQKVIAISMIMGFTVAFIMSLITDGAPWWNLFLAALVACVICLFVALGC